MRVVTIGSKRPPWPSTRKTTCPPRARSSARRSAWALTGAAPQRRRTRCTPKAEKPSTRCAATLTPVSLRSSRLGVASGCGAAGRASRKLNPCEKTRASAASSRRKESCGRHRARQSRRSRLHGYLPARAFGRSDSQPVSRGGEQGLRFCRTKQGCPGQRGLVQTRGAKDRVLVCPGHSHQQLRSRLRRLRAGALAADSWQ